MLWHAEEKLPHLVPQTMVPKPEFGNLALVPVGPSCAATVAPRKADPGRCAMRRLR